MSVVAREYEYRPRWTVIVLCAAFFGSCAIILGVKAANNQRGLLINGIIELGPEGATVFYWVLTTGSVGFVAAAALLVYHRLAYRQRLVFGATALIVPSSRWSRQEKEIAYQDISHLATSTFTGQRFLHIKYVGGKYTIMSSLLPSRAAFAEVCEQLAARVQEQQATAPAAAAEPPGD